MPWYFFLTLAIIVAAISTVVSRAVAAKKNFDPIAFSIFFQLVAGIAVAVFAVYKGIDFNGYDKIWPNLVLMAFLFAYTNVFKFKALKEIDASKYAVIFQFNTLIPVIAAVLLLGEKVNIWQGFGVAAILAGVILVTDGKIDLKREKGEVFAILTAIFMGSAIANDFFILKTVSVYTYVALAFLAPALLLAIIYPKSIKNIKNFTKKENLYSSSVAGIFYGLAAILIYTAFKIGNNAAQIAPLFQLTTILTVVLGIIFLKERENLLKKLLGAVLSFIGVILITLIK